MSARTPPDGPPDGETPKPVMASFPAHSSARGALTPPRLAGYGVAVSLHALALAGLAALPAAVTDPPPERAPGASLAFYVFVAEGAESDSPLFEPPLDEAAGAGGEADGEGRGAGVGEAETEAEAEDDAAPEPEADPEPEPEPAPEPEPEAPAPDPPETGPSQPETDEALRETGPVQPADTPDEAPPVPASEPRDEPDPFSLPRDPDRPVATTQLPPPEPGAAPAQAADIDIDALMAQVAIRLDPDEFRMVQGAIASRLVVRDSFCLSSSDANREAGDCPEDGPAGEIDLARFGLTGFGAVPPRFLEDMDRLEFELAQLGAGSGQIRRIMAELAEARRQAVTQSPILRQMERDEAGRRDAPMITPRRARDPSGEP
ncbi:hypothetical protein F1654_07965 [Alkalicaulis satelles]|uniref:Uncharacterized protein n=1 Tax=Alkalicaulis satelles TaxID=2609175 RepID=A0A5M6ZKH9_9PROT|nr:hypothetical protein [Alkalicaulis satelles]KAA5803728.1 hypothetical protein F1654_07965 [Alkalicaulis satelles]